MMLQVAWRTWGHREDRASYVQHTRAQVLLVSEPLQPLAQAAHQSPFEVTFPLPFRGAVIAPSCPRRDMEPTVQQMLSAWPGVWGHPSGGPMWGGSTTASLLLQELLPLGSVLVSGQGPCAGQWAGAAWVSCTWGICGCCRPRASPLGQSQWHSRLSKSLSQSLPAPAEAPCAKPSSSPAHDHILPPR